MDPRSIQPVRFGEERLGAGSATATIGDMPPSEIERAGQLAELPRRSGSAPSPTKPEAEDLRCHWAAKVPEDSSSSLHSSSGMMRRMNSSNIGTVKAVSPWPGLQIMPLPISLLRVGAKDCT